MKKKLFNEKTDWQRGLTTNVIYYMLSTKALPYIQRETVFFTEYQKQISVLIKVIISKGRCISYLSI